MTASRFTTRRSRLAAFLMLVLGAAAGCGGDRGAVPSTADRAPQRARGVGASDQPPGGTIVIATAGDAETLLPPLAVGVTARQATDMLFEPLAELGEGLNTIGDAGFRPRLARSWSWGPDSLSIAFSLDPRARWHDGAPVVAGDVRFTFALYRDPAFGAAAAADVASVDSVTVRDPRTAVFWFGRRSPEQFYTAAARLRILPAHLLARIPPADLRASEFARRPVGSGPFRFGAWDPQRRLELVADVQNPRGRAKLDRLVWSVAPDPAAALALLLSGAADVFEGVRPEHLAAIARRPDLTTVRYRGLQYGFLAFNLAPDGAARSGVVAPLAGDRELRRAITRALDRPRMVRNVFDTLADVPVGPFTRAQALVDTSARQLPFDPAAARRTLDSLGWRPGAAGGVRTRGGRPLAFTISVPRSSETRSRFAVLIQEQLRAVGVAANVEPLEFTTFMDRLGRRGFDAVINVWNLDNPSPWGVQELWGTEAARTPGSSNLAAYASAAFDAALDSARAARTTDDARRLLARAQQQINDDAPAVWLFEPRPLLAVHRRLGVVNVRADAWWAGLADWTVDPRRRIARDAAGPPGTRTALGRTAGPAAPR